MIRKLWNSAGGMLAQSLKIDVIANNVANMNTNGYKKKDVLFQDLIYRSQNGSGNPVEQNNISVGQGVMPAFQRANFQQGALLETGRELDMAIRGEGFFKIILPDGREAFSRVGTFYKDPGSGLVTAEGYPVEFFPEELREISFVSINVEDDGIIMLLNEENEEIGRAHGELYRFKNSEGLEAIGKNLWLSTEKSGEATRGVPGENGYGIIQQRFIEQSNVNIVEEMTNLILAQRAYEISSRAVRTADEMWLMANQIRK